MMEVTRRVKLAAVDVTRKRGRRKQWSFVEGLVTRRSFETWLISLSLSVRISAAIACKRLSQNKKQIVVFCCTCRTAITSSRTE